jgi:hypothetical protein
MKDLKELFIQRDKTHHDKTNEIASEVQHAFHGISEFIDQDADDIQWTGLGFNEEENSMVFNFQIRTPEEVRISSVNIPLEIISKGNKEEIVGFLVNIKREAKKAQEEAEEATRKKFTSRVKQMIEEDEGSIVMMPTNAQSGDDGDEWTGADVLRHIDKNKRTLH